MTLCYAGCTTESVTRDGGDGMTADEARRLRAHNAEMRRLLEKHQWSGLTPTKSYGACPECGGSNSPFADGHRVNCAIAAILVDGAVAAILADAD